MKRNNWIPSLNTPVFEYELTIPVTKDNFIEKLKKIESTILLSGKKYNLFNMIPDSLDREYGKDQSVSRLVENKMQTLKKMGRNAKTFLLDTSLWVDEEIGIEEINQQSDIYIYSKEGKVITNSFYYLDGMLSHCLGDEISFDELLENEKGEISLGFYSYSNIWFDSVDSYSAIAYSSNEEENDDNRELAFLNTPRLNSFIRDVRMVTELLGGDWSLDSVYPSRVTLDGILLDSKIIYQEDIDEGRVALPRL